MVEYTVTKDGPRCYIKEKNVTKGAALVLKGGALLKVGR